MKKVIVLEVILVLTALLVLVGCSNIEQEYYVAKVVNKTQTEEWLSYNYDVEMQLEDGSTLKMEVTESEYIDLKLNSKYKVYYDDIFKTFELIEETETDESDNKNIQTE